MAEEQLVLVVDDDQACREAFGSILERFGYSVLVAGNLEEAAQQLRELVRQGRRLRILLDIWLPPPNPSIIESRDAFIKEAKGSGFVDRIVLITGHLLSTPMAIAAQHEGVPMLDKTGAATFPAVLQRVLVEPLPP